MYAGNMLTDVVQRTFLLTWSVLLLTEQSWAYSSGAPISACSSLTPGHPYTPQTAASPFTINPKVQYYGPSAPIEVTLNATTGNSFKGFIIQARAVGSITPIGIFGEDDTGEAQRLDCPADFRANTLTHSSNRAKTSITFSWTAPNDIDGEIEFIGSFVQRYNTFWTNVRSFTLTDPCNPSPCNNGGTCNRVSGGFHCICASGFTGTVCDEVDVCAEGTCGPNGLQCLRSGQSPGSYVCQCLDGSYEINQACPVPTTIIDVTVETTVTESPVHPCHVTPNPCHNGGICFLNSVGNVQCICSGGYTGTNCEVPPDPCTSLPCENGGQCVSSGGTYTCVCTDEFLGQRCQYQNPCNPSPCQNSGQCTVTVDYNYLCTCGAAHSGPECQHTLGCSSSPCLNGGQCENTGAFGTQFSCTCDAMHTGAQCETGIDPCDPNPCLNGASCYRRGDQLGHFCDCADGYSGSSCEVTPPPTTPAPPTTPTPPTTRPPTTTSGPAPSSTRADLCLAKECQNGGTCVNGVCQCIPGYGGPSCEQDYRPKFENCPEGETITYVLETDSSIAVVDLEMITARSIGGEALPVSFVVGPDLNAVTELQFSPEFAAGQPVVAQAVDGLNVRNCTFTVRLEDRQSPEITCPQDVVEITSGTSAQVTWPAAEASDFADPNPTITYSRNSGSTFTADGTSVSVIARATDSSANYQECVFSVTVYQREYDCDPLPTVENAMVTCRINAMSTRECRVSCESGYVNALGSELVYTCVADSAGSFWDPKPSSGVCASAEVGTGLSKTATISFSLPTATCPSENQSLQATISSNVTDTLAANDLCTSGTVTACDNVSSQCFENSIQRRRSVMVDAILSRRRRNSPALTVDIGISSSTTSQSDVGQVESDIDSIASGIMDVADNGEFQLTVDGQVVTNNPANTQVDSEFRWSCGSGQVTSGSGCVSCPRGTYYDDSDNVCVYCRRGNYQDQTRQTSCSECPSGNTDSTGSTSMSDCIDEGIKLTQTHWILIYIGCGVAGAFIVLMFIVLLCCCCRQAEDTPKKSKGKDVVDNLTYLNRAFEDDGISGEMQYSGTLGRDGTLQTNGHATNGHIPNSNGDARLIEIPSDPEYLYAEVPVTSFSNKRKSDYEKIPRRANGQINSISARVAMEKASEPPSAAAAAPLPPPPPPSTARPQSSPADPGSFPPPPPLQMNGHQFNSVNDSAPIGAPPPPPPPPPVAPQPPMPPSLNNSRSASPSGSTSSGRRTTFQL
ncbi:uncharacterized protein [Diadema antillarum]|uniref:uncharacterized protein n=1 Tax=Diadema antillarum TaxID=105358 RepID=UPI003A870666